jgi:hypothetical protein
MNVKASRLSNSSSVNGSIFAQGRAHSLAIPRTSKYSFYEKAAAYSITYLHRRPYRLRPKPQDDERQAGHQNQHRSRAVPDFRLYEAWRLFREMPGVHPYDQ